MDLPQLASFIADRGSVLWDLFFLVPTGRARAEDMLSAEEHEEVFNWLYDLSQQSPMAIKTTLGQHYRRVVLQHSMEGSGAVSHAGGPQTPNHGVPTTNDGKGICFISHVGDIYPSGFLPVVTGNVRRDSLVDTYRNSPVFEALRNLSMLKGKCGSCPFNFLCGGCRARAYALTGSYLEAEPACVYEPDGDGK